MDKRKTLVILTPAFPATESESHWVPAVQIFARKLHDCFPDMRIEILSFNYPEHHRRYDWNGLPVTSFNGLNARKLRHAWLWIQVWHTLTRLRKETKIHGLLSFWCTECALIGSYFSRRFCIPHRIWISGMDAKKENKYVNWIKPKSEDLVSMSPFLSAQFLKNHLIRPAHEVLPGIDPDLFPRVNEERDIDILGVGSLVPLKQFDAFIRVIKAIATVRPGVKAVICGGGPAHDSLQALIRQLNLEDNIQLAGHCPHSDVMGLMQRSKVLLHTSAYEGFGMVCAEALYAGAKVISFVYPLNNPVSHWQVVKNEQDMSGAALNALEDQSGDHSGLVIQKMEDSARSMMALFETKKTASE